MIAAGTFKGKKVALFGLGGSGLATAHSLLAGGAIVLGWDDNPDSVTKAQSDGVPCSDLRQVDWTDIQALVLSPGVPLTHPRPHWTVELAREAEVPVIGDIELFVLERARLSPASPFIAITGTNGKSTTTALIAHMLNAAGRDVQMGGNIGRAVLTLDPPEISRCYVVECSSYQIDLAPSIQPSVGILLNLSPDHLDRHGTMTHYATVKKRLVAGSDLAIVGVDDNWSADIASRLEGEGHNIVPISVTKHLGRGLFADGQDMVLAENGNRRVVASLEGIGSLRGRHNAQNALAAIAACLSLGIDEEEIRAGLTSFPGLVHRMEEVGRRDDVLFINDSKATNAEAAATALASFDKIYWIAGGLAKSGGIEGLRSFFPRIAKAYLIGEAAPAFAATLGEDVPFEISGSLGNAVAHAAADAHNGGGGVVLLSPACASFDQFRNFEVRGDAFREAVRALDTAITTGETCHG